MTSPSFSRERLGLLLGFVGMVIFGGTLPATRIAVSAIDPIALTSLRAALAGLCSLALLVVLRRPLPPRALWPQLVITMLCVVILFPFLMALGMQTVDASHGGVVFGIMPIATALVAVMITHERPRPLFWIASFAGAALVIAFALRQGGGAMSAGDLLLFAAVAVSAIGYAFSGRLTSQMPGWEVISWVLVIALPISIPAAALTMPAGHRAAFRRSRGSGCSMSRCSRNGSASLPGMPAWRWAASRGCRRCSCCSPSSPLRSPPSSTARPSRRRSCCSPPPWWRRSRSRRVPAAQKASSVLS